MPTPDFIKDAARLAITENKTYYTPNAGYPEVRKAVADRIRDFHRVEVDPMREVVVTSSGMTAILLAVQATIGPGDSAIVLTPLWPNLVGGGPGGRGRGDRGPLGVLEGGISPRFRPARSGREAEYEADLAWRARGTRRAGWRRATIGGRSSDSARSHDLWLMADGAYERIVFQAEGRAEPALDPGGEGDGRSSSRRSRRRTG